MLLTDRVKHIISNDPKILFDLKIFFYLKIIAFSKFSRNVMKINENQPKDTHFGTKPLISDLKIKHFLDLPGFSSCLTSHNFVMGKS